LKLTDFAIRSQIIWVKQHFALSRGDDHWAHQPAWYAVRGTWRADAAISDRIWANYAGSR
jgi:hypothetical protein